MGGIRTAFTEIFSLVKWPEGWGGDKRRAMTSVGGGGGGSCIQPIVLNVFVDLRTREGSTGEGYKVSDMLGGTWLVNNI